MPKNRISVSRPSWRIPERLATPEGVFLNRRTALGLGLAAGASVAMPRPAAALFGFGSSKVYGPPEDDPSTALYPVPRNDAFKLDRDVTPAEYNYNFNNYYEFGSSKSIAASAQALPIRPWEISIEGLVEKPFKIGIDDLLKAMPLEERLYRHRCVEAWSMAIPWSGFPLRALVEHAKPLGSAKYLEMITFENPKVASGQSATWYPWPYREGLTIAEATNDLAFIATGAYGKPLPKQMGSPLRLAVPWKYGFKSVKAIIVFKFTEERPATFWADINKSEYGFWANVNPEVPHPRWSQASERILGTDEQVPTQLYNGYGEQVASLYDGVEGEALFM